jgi:hypothetical protein
LLCSIDKCFWFIQLVSKWFMNRFNFLIQILEVENLGFLPLHHSFKLLIEICTPSNHTVSKFFDFRFSFIHLGVNVTQQLLYILLCNLRLTFQNSFTQSN